MSTDEPKFGIHRPVTVALAGNPNSGKTTIFNALTGARQHVGNYPGVTVEKKEGHRSHKGLDIRFVDLPGTYSLTAYSVEEIIARNFLLHQQPDLVVHVIDASNLERNLYLSVQLMELGVPLLLAFNMSDVARQRGLIFDIPLLSQLLGAPIIPTVGSKSQGIDRLLDKVVEIVQTRAMPVYRYHYGTEVEQQIGRIVQQIDAHPDLARCYRPRWLAIKLLEQDREIRQEVQIESVLETAHNGIRHLETIYGDEAAIVLADQRYGFISGACQEAVKSTVESRHDVSDRIDAILTHRALGLPIFLGLMYAVFQLVFHLGEYPMNWLESSFHWLGGLVASTWPPDSNSILKSLLVDGIIGGVGGVLVFLPNIFLLFLAIAFLEDSGYMARAAFIMDRLMHKMGLHGKSFIPMLIGFGCSVPAIMATRILENRRSRLTTIMIIPLMSCGARFPIYALIIPAFFPEHMRGLILWGVYLIGIVLAVICARLLRKTLLKGQTVPFVMELPPYRMPTARGLWLHTRMRSWHYVKKAGTIILGISIVLWGLTSFPRPSAEQLEGLDGEQIQSALLRHSIAGRVGKTIEPAIRPLGFDWKIGTALIGAMAAKEVFVSQLGIVYSLGEVDEGSAVLRERLRADYTPLQGFCVMLFCLISAPCMATVAITRREAGAWKWALFQWAALTILAYGLTLIVFQIGSIISKI
ncbi:MAG: ferrous iron transport protein B [Sedimentisphaerales bacterium]|nr:ferrous iron transport protein B [Sedimentisphaerales bacterium]